MKLKDKFTEYFDTFYDEVSKIIPLTIPDKTTLSNDLFINYGNRTILNNFEVMEITSIFKIIANKFVPKWEKIISIQKEEFITGIETVEKWSGSDSIDYSKNTTITETKQVMPYNDESFSDTDKQTNSTTGTDVETRNKGTNKTTKVTSGKSTDYIINFINYLKSNNIYDIINKEVAQFLTIMIRSEL